MDLKSISDDELINLINEEDENAKNIVFDKYKYIIDIILKKYEPITKDLQMDKNELYSEALYGFSDGIHNYVQEKDASLPTFITLCVTRRITNYIRKCKTQKNMSIKSSYSFDYVYDKYGMTLSDIVSDKYESDPLIKITNKESYDELNNKIKGILSEFEYQVFLYMLSDLNYNDIAIILNKEPKQIDNTMQRIKNKIKMIINN
jgi:RNA polymerase sporulation-specific sigma factor